MDENLQIWPVNLSLGNDCPAMMRWDRISPARETIRGNTMCNDALIFAAAAAM